MQRRRNQHVFAVHAADDGIERPLPGVVGDGFRRLLMTAMVAICRLGDVGFRREIDGGFQATRMAAKGHKAVGRRLTKRPVSAYLVPDGACCEKDSATKSTKARARAAD